MLGTHTYPSPEPSNEPIHFTSSYEALPTAMSLTLAQEADRAERAMGWLLVGLAALLAVVAYLIF